jgi:uncharacterized membrane protein
VGSGKWAGRLGLLSSGVLFSTAHAELSDKINSVDVMYGCGLGFGLLVGLLCWWAVRRSVRFGLGVGLGYSSLAICWNVSMYLGDASINPAIIHGQGTVYFWHQGLSVLLTILIVGAAFTLARKQRTTLPQPYFPH